MQQALRHLHTLNGMMQGAALLRSYLPPLQAAITLLAGLGKTG